MGGSRQSGQAPCSRATLARALQIKSRAQPCRKNAYAHTHTQQHRALGYKGKANHPFQSTNEGNMCSWLNQCFHRSQLQRKTQGRIKWERLFKLQTEARCQICIVKDPHHLPMLRLALSVPLSLTFFSDNVGRTIPKQCKV